MRLTRVQIQGFKRFLEPTSMEVSEDVVCILGPNGSGKSSFLEALVYLNSDGEFVPSDLSRVRGAGPVPGIVATFELTSRDREELTDVPEAKEAAEFSVHKEADGALKYSMSPRPRRERTQRKRAITALKKLAKSKGPERIDEYESQGEEAPTASIRGSLDDCLAVLATEEENLSDGELATLDELRVRLSTFVEDDAVTGGVEASRSPVAPIRALEALSAAVEGENEEHPYDRSIGALVPLVPTFLKFDEQSRDLRSEYDLNEGAPDPGPAIKNLLRLGGTSWESAAQVASSGDMGMKKAWIESVDGALKEKIGGAWGQQRLDVSADIDGDGTPIVSPPRVKVTGLLLL